MTDQPLPPALQRLVDKDEIHDAMARYARGVDRGDWALVASTYHPDAHDEHGEYKGGIMGLIAWLEARFTGVDNSTHFLGNCLIEFEGEETALVETYFVSRRLRQLTQAERADAGPSDAICRDTWGRYVDRFERREGEWRVAHRTVVLEANSESIALNGVRPATRRFGQRDKTDRLYEVHAEIFGRNTPKPARAL